MSLRNIFTKVSIQRNNRGICELANLHSQCIIWMLGDPIYFSLLASTSSNSSRKFPPKHSSVSSSRILQDSLSSSFYQLCDRSQRRKPWAAGNEKSTQESHKRTSQDDNQKKTPHTSCVAILESNLFRLEQEERWPQSDNL